ncbi:MAG: magnesium transporter [Paracoccus denitrificans]|nr:MAG: magnesium transporter [Paracoccus denitrificans]PZO82962.1 MAG: magnesium transporter [Paracoccus denitrificans]
MTDPRPRDSDYSDDDFAPNRALVTEIEAAIDDDDHANLDELLEPLHAADIADLIEQLGPQRRREFLRLYSGEIDGEILTEIDEAIREEVIDQLPQSVLEDAVREMDSDDVVDLVEDLEGPEREKILSALEESDRITVEQSLTYPEHSAGRLMQPEVVTAPEHWTVGETIDFLRAEEWLPDQFYHVVLVDPRRHPIGYVTLGRLLSAQRATPLRDLTEDSFRVFDVLDEEGDVAYAFNQYHLISAPVVDADGRLVGAITIDDAMAVLDSEHEEDLLRLAGVGEESSLSDGVIETVKQRVPWLLVNLFAANIAAFVISRFSGTIESIVALAALMPIVASMGGNAGTQSLAVAVRALATKDLTASNASRVVTREAIVGLTNGVLFAIIMALVGYFAFGSWLLGSVLAAALIINLMVAALAGVLVPLTLDRLNLDPALAAGTFVTTLTDVIGFLSFLGLATWILL